mgnify:CR=1 FL=1
MAVTEQRAAEICHLRRTQFAIDRDEEVPDNAIKYYMEFLYAEFCNHIGKVYEETRVDYRSANYWYERAVFARKEVDGAGRILLGRGRGGIVQRETEYIVFPFGIGTKTQWFSNQGPESYAIGNKLCGDDEWENNKDALAYAGWRNRIDPESDIFLLLLLPCG